MRAARAEAGATVLALRDIPEPALRPGSVIVRPEAAFASAFIARIVDGTGTFVAPDRPFTPGMDVVGVVEAVAPGLRGIEPGTRVYVDPRHEPPFAAQSAERVFIGSFALGPQSKVLLQEWPDGGYAERMVVPAEAVVPIPPEINASPAQLTRLGWLATAYGALRKVDMARGAVVAVNGASGLVGSGAVAVALALGAARVFAIGRRPEALQAVASLDPRVTPVTDIAGLPPIDVALTCASAPDASSLEALYGKLRRRGAFVIVAAPKAAMSIPVHWTLSNDITIRGSSWFERAHLLEMIRLIAAGVLDLSVFEAETFPLDQVNEALGAARERPNPLRHVAVVQG